MGQSRLLQWKPPTTSALVRGFSRVNLFYQGTLPRLYVCNFIVFDLLTNAHSKSLNFSTLWIKTKMGLVERLQNEL